MTEDNQSLEEESGTSRGDECPTDSLDDDAFSSCSSSKDAFESFSSEWLPRKSDKHSYDDWDFERSPKHLFSKEKPGYAICCSSDVEAMKEKFSKLLLGEDVTGGCNASIFGELWKLEPLSEEKKQRWRREMDWLLSPTNHMIELVPSKQDGANGRSLEIMTPKAHADIHMNLPALRKLDSMLIETLDSMVNTEFWYSEVGHRADGNNKITRESKRWWLPSPKVPKPGLSNSGRKKLIEKGNVVYQIFKAAKSINETVLLEMPVPTIIKDALHKDIGHAILEAYSRILANLAFRILSRIGEILEEDALSNPNSPAPLSCFSGSNDLSKTPERFLISSRLRHSLIYDMDKADDGTRNGSTDPKASSFSLI